MINKLKAKLENNLDKIMYLMLYMGIICVTLAVCGIIYISYQGL